MEVLEEEELRVMREQQRSFEEIRNVKLIEAHRLEAKELRRKQEIDRRRNQQRAIKSHKIEQDKKYESRLIAKQFLNSQRDENIQRMQDEGVLVERLPGLLVEEVVPWLYDRVQEFLNDDIFINDHVEKIFEIAFENGEKTHKETLIKIEQEKKDHQEDLRR